MPLWRHPEFRVGAREISVVSAGLAAWGVMTGVAIVKSGLGFGPVLLMSTIVFAGSSQLAALPLIASGAPIWVIVATAFCVNLRFVVFSAHLRHYVMHLPLWRRLLGAYGTADMGYVLLTKRFPEPPSDPAGRQALEAYWAGSGLTGWAWWTGATLLGVAFGNSVPVSWGMGFAGILALLAVTVSLIGTPLRAVSAMVAGGAAIVSVALPLKLNILVAIVAAVVVCLMFERTAAGSTSPTRLP